MINNRSFNLSNDMIKNKIFEEFLFLPLKEHFQKICLKILQRKNTLLSNFKYKGFYVIELENPKILFSLSSIISKNKIEKISNLDSLWKELLYHLTNLKHSYKEKFSNKFESSDYQDYFVKLEYTSTFPRLIFIIDNDSSDSFYFSSTSDWKCNGTELKFISLVRDSIWDKNKKIPPLTSIIQCINGTNFTFNVQKE